MVITHYYCCCCSHLRYSFSTTIQQFHHQLVADTRIAVLCKQSSLYADDACIVSRSPQGLAKVMDVIVEVCRAFALTVSAKKTETMCMSPPRTPRTMVRIEAAGQIYKQVQSFTYLRGHRDRNPGYYVR